MKRSAFSLVELSIVLVILGLLVGGILAGQSLIRAAELRSVSSDFTKYRTAVASFKDKYFALPGDLTSATSFWGAADGNDGIGTDCAQITTAATGTATCNGDGNGVIGNNGSGCPTNYEPFRLWQHLANAGLAEGGTSGVYQTYGTGTYPCRGAIPGLNIPRSRIANAGFEIARQGLQAPMNITNTNMILFGAAQYVTDSYVEAEGAALKNEEAWNIDAKMDDGMPYTGQIKTYPYNWYGKWCATGTGITAPYDLSRTDTVCSLTMLLGI